MDRAFVPFDDGLGDLGPLSDLRASFEQRTGGCTVLERCRLAGTVASVAVPSARAALAAERCGVPANAAVDGAVLVNGRLQAPFEGPLREALRSLAAGQAIVDGEGTVVAACLGAGASRAFVEAVAAGTRPAAPGACRTMDLALWTRPWHVLDAARFDAALAGDAAQVSEDWDASVTGVLPAHAHHVGPHALHLHARAKVGVGVVFDCSAGPVLVDDGAEVRHHAVINGPAFIGAKTVVSEGALIKPRAAIGPQCRVAGEVGSVTFQGCTNKAHDGHLGDALLGEWVNLGAGTVNSNLLNTYGEVVMRLRPDGPLERSGRQFMGCLVGDHAKLAIGTRIMTGSSIGTGAMWAASTPVTGAVVPFAWVTDDGERRFILRKFLDLARTVMARRGAAPGPAALAHLERLHGPD
jgi:UDP-N-acetylglucosamine diphosphorylase/glucosamine-1-phosphate N-acetyltransferase